MKNRAIQVRMVKGDAVATDAPVAPVIDPAELDRILKGQVEHIALTIGMLLLAKKAADTASELILIAGRKYI